MSEVLELLRKELKDLRAQRDTISFRMKAVVSAIYAYNGDEEEIKAPQTPVKAEKNARKKQSIVDAVREVFMKQLGAIDIGSVCNKLNGKFSRKAVSNAMGYLARNGEIRSLGRGSYRKER